MQSTSCITVKAVILYCFIAFCCKAVLAFTVSKDIESKPFRIVQKQTEFAEEARADCTCGKENDTPVNRIMGGVEVDPPHKYPWMAALLVRRNDGSYFFFCGGALINRQYVLTASHCLENKRHLNITVALGIHDIRSSAEVLAPAVELKMHLYYTRVNFRADIALIKLQDPVTYSKKVRPICLPDKVGMGLANDQVVVAGWGKLHPSGTVTRFLREVQVPIVANSVCETQYLPGEIISSNICAGEAGKDSCQGDSGGPLMYKKNDQWHEVGVVSWGESCGLPNYPGVYCRVSFYVDWVNYHSSDAPACV